MHKEYQKEFNIITIDDNLLFFEKEPIEEEIKENIDKIFFVVSTKTNLIEMKVVIKKNRNFIMYIRENLESFIINKIKTTIKMHILKKNPYIHPEEKHILETENKSSNGTNVEKEYLKYALKSANIFQMPKLDKEYLQYFISHNEKELDNNTLSFIYIVLDKFLDSLTRLPNRELLHKTISLNKEVIFNLDENEIEMTIINKGYLMFIDLNNLKAINDIYGHNTADALLISFADILKRKFKEVAHFRLGGDEFISTSENEKVLKELSEYLHSLEFNRDIKKDIKKKTGIEVDGNLLFFASNGIEALDLKQKNLLDTLHNAELKMYVNKSLLHLKYGVYDRREEGEQGQKTKLIGVIKSELINKIKTSEKFKNKTSSVQYDFLYSIKKNAMEIDKLEQDYAKAKENRKSNIREEQLKYKKAISRLLESI